MKSVTLLTMLFYFTTIKMKTLALVTTLFYFTFIKMNSLIMFCTVLLHYNKNENFDYAHYPILLY